MSPFAMFVLLLTIAYVIYYGVNICRDLFSKKGQTKSDTEEYEVSDDEGGRKKRQSPTPVQTAEVKPEPAIEKPTMVEEQQEEEDNGQTDKDTEAPAPQTVQTPSDDADNDKSAENEDFQEIQNVQENLEQCPSQDLFSNDQWELETGLKDEDSNIVKTIEPA